MDGHDEHNCQYQELQRRRSENLPVIVEFKRSGLINIKSLQSKDSLADVVCPETHFWCPGKDYCLPVFVRCNGVYDCPGHEDEEGCDVYTCPGFYRCRASKICLHMSHVCDDWPVCPQHDDELLCEQHCPKHCTCYGLAFFCSHVFAAHQFPDLRYLDVRGSGMDVLQLNQNHMLVHLSLAWCKLTTVSNLTFHNLHSLDLSDNLLTEVSVLHFALMQQLTVLFLPGNPLTSVFTAPIGPNTKLTTINTLDLSRVEMHSVHHSLFKILSALHTLNLSHSGLTQLQSNSSDMSGTYLRKLDLRGCMITQFSQNVLRSFPHLQVLLTDNFLLCCPSVLPPDFDLNLCYVNPDDVSSCNNLLGSVTYRSAVAVMATLTLLGNVASLMLRVCVSNTWQLSNQDVLLTHLSVADLGAGLYLVTLGLADRILAGGYVWQDSTWRKGAVCHLAGVLALSCRHAATFLITILTLDRCLHYCPTIIPRLNLTKIKVLCVVVWLLGLFLSTGPLMTQWRFFGQQALCVPLPHKRSESMKSHYVYAAQVLVHFLMFIVCTLFEVVNRMVSRKKISGIMNKTCFLKDSQFVVFGSLASGFLYTIACLLPTDSYSDKQRATHTALVFFGSVASSSLNPYLHLYGVRVERNQRIREERLTRIVKRARR